MFRQLDRHGNGRITQEEAGPGRRQLVLLLLEMADNSSNDSITRDEFGRLAEQHRRSRAPASPRTELSERAEANTGANRRLSRADLRRVLDQFSQLDRNRDGIPDADEWQSTARSRGEDGNIRTVKTPRANDSSAPNAMTPLTGGTDRLILNWRGWVVDGLGDNTNSVARQLELQIHGNRVTTREIGTNRAGGALGRGTFVVDTPNGHLDATGTDDPQQNKQCRGIF